MNRRDSIKTLVAVSGGLIALPSWAKEWRADSLNITSSPFSFDEQATLASVADTIIPPGNSIGALSVGVDKFMQKLFADCYEKEAQESIKAQLIALDSTANTSYGKSFATCDQSQRQEMLHKLSISENKIEKDFFTTMKSETIRGFTTSREVMMNYLNYKPVPGHYYGCVDVKA
jgi:hypothetical protein